MASTNKKTTKSHVYNKEERLAGGYGVYAAKQRPESELRRLVMANLLWEDNAYVDGESVSSCIRSVIPNVDPLAVRDIAIEARTKQKLRHVPLFIAREMLRHDTHKGLVSGLLPQIILRPDELCEFVSIYWKEGKRPLAAQAKKGLAAAFHRFDEYQLAKWDKPGKDVRIRDVLFLCHAKPQNQEQGELWKRLINGELQTPDTWEVAISASKSKAEKAEQWTRLLESGKLGAFALLKNLRNIQDAGVTKRVIAEGIKNANPSMLLPIDFLKVIPFAPSFIRELEDLMFRCCCGFKKLPGFTIFVVDVSGSMCAQLSSKSVFNRMGAASAMAVLAAEMCEHVTIYATAGDDRTRTHKTEQVPSVRGFALADKIMEIKTRLGGGGIFTRQCLEYIRQHEIESPDRIIVFSDSQDCDYPGSGKPKPFGHHNYIVDVSAHKNGVNYSGVWTAEVSGWSEHFLRYISELEGSVELQAN